jgi:tetratricopeptide (TPR) repeat protein
VFWVHASTTARFEQSFRDIANRVKIPGRQNPTANIFQLVHDWLCDETKGKWTLILDNVDDVGFLKARKSGQDGDTGGIEGGNSRPLVSYLPQCSHGSILITSRSGEAALQLVRHDDIIKVDPMEKREALELFRRKVGPEVDDDGTDDLVRELESIPLAITQAAAYVREQGSRCSVRKYLQDFEKNDRKKERLLGKKGGMDRRDWEAENCIIITWQISFEYIQTTRRSAAELLSLMSFFDRQGIPDTLLRHRNEQRDSAQDPKHNNKDSCASYDTEHNDHDEDDASQSSADEKFEDDVSILRQFSFISANQDSTTFEMHGLVQLATRKWLEAHGQIERWKHQFIRNLNAELPTGEHENWEKCQTLFPHAQSAAVQKPKEQESLEDWASVLYKAAWYAWRIGKGVEAENLAFTAMKVRKKILGDEHGDTLDGMAMVGLAYTLNGRWDEAEKLDVQVMETSKTKLGVDHPDTLTSMANLAATFRNQGRWDEAEKLEVQVMETRKTKLGVDHPDTLTSMANLASTFWNQGRWDEAEKLDVQVMETSKTKLGVDHPSTLTSMANLAATFRNQGRWDEAEKLEVQVMETSKTKLGVDHPDTLTSMANLAFTWKGIGKEIEAIRLMENCIQLRKRILGVNHPHFISSCTALDVWKAEQEDATLLV